MLFSRQIHQFIAIARAGSFIRAADEIAVTPSALSHGITELEQRLGKKLIVRKKSGAFLTSYGSRFYSEISPLYDKGMNILKRTKSEMPKIVISIDGFLNPTLPRKIENLFKYFEGRIDIVSGNSTSSLEDILDEKYDLLLDVSCGLDYKIPESIYRIALPPETLGIVASNKVLNKYQYPTDMLKSEKIFQRNTALQHRVFRDLEKHMSEHSVKCSFIGLPDISDVMGALSLDMGICIASSNLSEHPVFSELNLNFIKMPEPLKFTLNRGIYIKKERFEELSDVLTCIQSE